MLAAARQTPARVRPAQNRAIRQRRPLLAPLRAAAGTQLLARAPGAVAGQAVADLGAARDHQSVCCHCCTSRRASRASQPPSPSVSAAHVTPHQQPLRWLRLPRTRPAVVRAWRPACSCCSRQPGIRASNQSWWRAHWPTWSSSMVRQAGRETKRGVPCVRQQRCDAGNAGGGYKHASKPCGVKCWSGGGGGGAAAQHLCAKTSAASAAAAQPAADVNGTWRLVFSTATSSRFMQYIPVQVRAERAQDSKTAKHMLAEPSTSCQAGSGLWTDVSEQWNASMTGVTSMTGVAPGALSLLPTRLHTVFDRNPSACYPAQTHAARRSEV